eukprot:XP_004918777.2 PREDICTED: Z-DNA-binding protein 1 [Xenopus tropicalis]
MNIHLLETQIYNFLQNNGQQKAAAIAKELKTEKSKINPALYDMKKKNLLTHDEKIVWSVKKEEISSGDLLPSDRQSSTDRRLSDSEHGARLTKQQNDIYLFLKNNSPQKSISIARGINKSSASEVNPDLYQLKDMNLLQRDSSTKLWSVKPDMVDNHNGEPENKYASGTTFSQNGNKAMEQPWKPHAQINNYYTIYTQNVQVGHGNIMNVSGNRDYSAPTDVNESKKETSDNFVKEKTHCSYTDVPQDVAGSLPKQKWRDCRKDKDSGKGIDKERDTKLAVCNPAGTDIKPCNCYLCELEQSLSLGNDAMGNTDETQTEPMGSSDSLQPSDLSEICNKLEDIAIAGEATNNARGDNDPSH